MMQAIRICVTDIFGRMDLKELWKEGGPLRCSQSTVHMQPMTEISKIYGAVD